MGLLRKDRILSFEEMMKLKNEMKLKGIEQFIHIHNKKKNVKSLFSVGDEIEMLLTADQNGRKVLTLVSEEMIECFNFWHGDVVEMIKQRQTDSNEHLLNTKKKIEENISQNVLSKYQNIIDEMKLPKHSKHELLYLLHYNLQRISDHKEFFTNEINNSLNVPDSSINENKETHSISLIPEFSSYMLETIPLAVHTDQFQNIFHDMHKRISLISSLHKSFIPCSKVMLMTCFPMLYLSKSDFEELSNENDAEKPDHLTSVFFYNKIKTYDFSIRSKNLSYAVTNSLHFPDNAINNHPRFGGILQNITSRRGKRIEGYVAIMNDACKDIGKISIESRRNTMSFSDVKVENEETDAEDLIKYFEGERYKQKKVPTILIDSMGQGMGCSCLQLTYQLNTYDMCRFVFDQLTILAPLLMRIMRSTPFNTNHMLNIDTRWEIIAMAVDDRTKKERGSDVEVIGLCKCGNCNNFNKNGFNFDIEEEMMKNKYFEKKHNKKRNEQIMNCDENNFLPQWKKIEQDMVDRELEQSKEPAELKKSRFSSTDLFIHSLGEDFNDTHVKYDANYYAELIKEGVDEMVAKHISSLFVRDPVVYYETQNTSEDQQTVTYDDFENIQSSNWRSTRFKIPIDDGWRVELRSLEIQPTVYENSGFSVFISLLVKWLISQYERSYIRKEYDTDFLYIPMSLVEINFKRASLFQNKESDYIDKQFPENEKLFEEFHDLFMSKTEEKNGKKLTFSSISKTHHDYGVKAPKDKIKFFYRDINSNEIKEDTIENIFVQFCDQLVNAFPQYRNEIEFVRSKSRGKFVSTSDFLRYTLINDSDYVKGSGRINRNMTDKLIIKMDKIRKMDHWMYSTRKE